MKIRFPDTSILITEFAQNTTIKQVHERIYEECTKKQIAESSLHQIVPTTRLLTESKWLDKPISEAEFAAAPTINTLLVYNDEPTTEPPKNTTTINTEPTSVWYKVMIAASVFAIAGFVLSRKQQ